MAPGVSEAVITCWVDEVKSHLQVIILCLAPANSVLGVGRARGESLGPAQRSLRFSWRVGQCTKIELTCSRIALRVK